MLLDKTKVCEPRARYWSNRADAPPGSYVCETGAESRNDWMCADTFLKVFDIPPWSTVQLFAYDKPGKYRARVELCKETETDASGQEYHEYFVRIPDVSDADIGLDESLERRVRLLLKKGYKVIYVECEYEEIGEAAPS